MIYPFRLISALWLLGFTLLPFSTGTDAALILNAGTPVLMVLAVVFLTYRQELDGRPERAILSGLTFMIAGTALISVLASAQLTVSGWRAVYWIGGMVLFIGLTWFERLRWFSTRLIAHGLILSGSVLASYYLINFIQASIESGIGEVLIQRYVGGIASLPWGASNVIAGSLLIALITAGIAHRAQPRRRYLLALVIVFLAIVATTSRTAVGLGGVYLLVLIISNGWRTAMRLVSGLILIAGVTYWTVLRVDPLYWQVFLTSRTDTGNVTELNGRTDIWSDLLVQYQQGGWQPVGFYASNAVFGHTGHNVFITALVEQGPIAPVLLTLLFAALIVLRVQHLLTHLHAPQRPLLLLALLGLLIVLAELWFEDSYFSQPFAFCFWAFLALAVKVGVDAWTGVVNDNQYDEQTVTGASRYVEVAQSRL